jgi:exopolysaccharide biosynthesis polyprenyl glycosylphosphotransferase
VIHFDHLRRRKWFALGDFLVVCLAIYLAFVVRTKIPLPVFAGLLPESPNLGFDSYVFPSVILGGLYVCIQYAFGIYDLWHSPSLSNWLQRVLPANLILLGFAFTYLYLTQNFNFPRSLMVVVAVFNYLLSAMWRVLYFRITEAKLAEVVLVGRWTDISALVRELSSPPFDAHMKVKAVFIPSLGDTPAPPANVSFPVFPFEEFEQYSSSNPYASVILAPSDTFQHQAFQCVLSAARRGINIYAVPTLYEILLGRLQHLRINDLPMLELRLDPPSGFSTVAKRVFDLGLSLLLLVILFVPMAIIALIVKLTSPGPAIYSQIRVGRFGREFRIYKFRSMVVNAEDIFGLAQARKNDPRFTSIGRILRATRLDELPQLWNIIRGDMSFVGPRPLLREEVSVFDAAVMGFSERHRVRPGVTGLAQVSGNYVTSPDVKLKYDLAYISNQNVFFDAQILFRTLKAVLTRSGQ